MKPPAAHDGGGPATRLPSLTGLRALGALLVFGFHVGTLRIMAHPTHAKAVAHGFGFGLSGVQFFYILSGFVLVWSARTGPGQRRRFWRRRAAKVFPAHIVMWAAVLIAYACWAIPVPPLAVIANLFLVQAWLPMDGWYYSVNTVSWSLSCELFFYLCLPLALPYLRRMPVWALYTILIAMPLLIAAMWPGQLLVPEAKRWWFTQVFPLARSTEFWLGVAAAELLRRGRWRGPGLALASALFVLTWIVARWWVPAQLWTSAFAIVYVLVIAAAAQADVQGRRTIWRSRPLIWLGEVSFAYYLCHVFVISTVLRLLDHPNGFPGWQGPAAVAVLTALCLFIAWLMFRYVETPMMRLLAPARRDAAPRQRTPVGSTA